METGVGFNLLSGSIAGIAMLTNLKPTSVLKQQVESEALRTFILVKFHPEEFFFCPALSHCMNQSESVIQLNSCCCHRNLHFLHALACVKANCCISVERIALSMSFVK